MSDKPVIMSWAVGTVVALIPLLAMGDLLMALVIAPWVGGIPAGVLYTHYEFDKFPFRGGRA